MSRKEKEEQKSNEVVVPVDLSFDALITVLNTILQKENNQNKNLKKIPNAQWLSTYLLSVWEQLKREANPKFKNKNKQELKDPKLDNTQRTLAHGLPAWIGDKPYHKKIGNKDMVIGFGSEGLDGYRVDYDPGKGLHVNVEMKMKDGSRIAIQPKLESERYNFSDPVYVDENIKAEFMKIKHWVKMTLGRALQLDMDVGDYQQIFSSLFCEQHKKYSFESCKEKIKQHLSDFQELADQVESCLNERTLAILVEAEHKIRQAFINAVFQVHSSDNIDSYAMHEADSEESDAENDSILNFAM